MRMGRSVPTVGGRCPCEEQQRMGPGERGRALWPTLCVHRHPGEQGLLSRMTGPLGKTPRRPPPFINPFAFESIGYLFKVKSKNFKIKFWKDMLESATAVALGQCGNRRLRGLKAATAAVSSRNEGSFRAGMGTGGLPTFLGILGTLFLFFYIFF